MAVARLAPSLVGGDSLLEAATCGSKVAWRCGVAKLGERHGDVGGGGPDVSSGLARFIRAWAGLV
jgi:hypothetical protein